MTGPGPTEPRLGRVRQRLRAAGLPIVHTGLAAGLAWFVASFVFGYEAPFFAPVGAVIALGTTLGRRGRRTVEMVLGVAVGIAIADLIVLGIGTGAWQLAMVTVLAMGAAVTLNGSPLLATQAAISAILVATIEPPTTGLVPHRFFHALIGGAIAVLVSQVLLPIDPLRVVRRAAGPVFRGLSDALARTARALASGDVREAEAALLEARAMDAQVRGLHEALSVAHEAARFAPYRRTVRGRVDSYADAATQVDLAVRNTRVLARASIQVIRAAPRRAAAAPPALAEAVGDLARGVEALGAQLLEGGEPDRTRRYALDAVAVTASLFEDQHALAVSRVVGQVRSTVIDLLRSSGLDLETAQRRVEDAAAAPGGN